MTSSLKIAELLGNSSRTINNWRCEERPIIKFIEKYLSDNLIDEFLKTGKISTFELSKAISPQISEIRKIFFDELQVNEEKHFIDIIKKSEFELSKYSHEWIFKQLKTSLLKIDNITLPVEAKLNILLNFSKLSTVQQSIVINNIQMFTGKNYKYTFTICIIDDNQIFIDTIKEDIDLMFSDNYDFNINVIEINKNFNDISINKSLINFYIIDYLLDEKDKKINGISLIKKYNLATSKCLIFTGEDINKLTLDKDILILEKGSADSIDTIEKLLRKKLDNFSKNMYILKS